jgi:F0F1-type ATP synthase delta subunit
MKISPDLRTKLRTLIDENIHKQRERCVIKLAHKIPQEEIDTIIKKIAGEGIAELEPEVVIDKSIIAGFIFAKGSTVHDYSLRSKIFKYFT